LWIVNSEGNICEKEQWLSIDETSLARRSKRRRQSEYPDIKMRWVFGSKNAVRDNTRLTDHIVKRKQSGLPRLMNLNLQI